MPLVPQHCSYFAGFGLLAIKMHGGGLKVMSCFPEKYLLPTQGQTNRPRSRDEKLTNREFPSDQNRNREFFIQLIEGRYEAYKR